MRKENKKRETKKGKMFVLVLAFAFILTTGLASAWYCGDGIIQGPNVDGVYEQCDDGNTANYDGCSSNCTIESPCNLQLTKSVSKQTAKPNDILTYTLKYKNIGGSVCTGGGVKVQDTLNSNLNYMGSFNKNILNDVDGQGLNSAWYEIPGYNESTKTLTWNAHAVSPNEEGTITFDVKVLTPTQCGDFQIPNHFKTWSNQEDWKTSNTVNINVDYNCPVCGDGIINQANETCDDGNKVNNDGCSSTCKNEVCGDGIKQTSEQCDLGLSNGIACTPAYGGSCTYCSGICKNITLTGGVCGDGIKQTSEQCDDGNKINGDGCSANCDIEIPYCGDSRINQANETCDDGNKVNNDGCSSTCKLELCGDGTVNQANETCDDGNKVNNDGCSSTCTLEEGCNIELTKSTNKDNVKPGDIVTFTLKYKNTGQRVCTGGGVKIQDTLNSNLNYMGSFNKNILNDVDGQGLDSDWYEIPGYEPLTKTLTWNAHVVSPGEEGTITFDVKVLTPAQCGDFEIPNYFKAWSNEENWKNSNTVKLFVEDNCPSCGDNVLNAGEECDDGNTVNGDGCSSTCDIEQLPKCGDGTINQANETCDDGNLVNNDGCSSICKLESCGDGIKQTGEQCDDGNKVNNDGCSSTCKNEVCGDGIKQTGEQCDDGNTVNGDGCSAQCRVEEQHYCGDGIKDIGEECDLGGENGVMCTPAYGGICTYCSNICDNISLTNGYCGDGILQSQYEECDDGNVEDGDGCSANCDEEQKFCEEDVSIRKSYVNSYGTGIAIGFENLTWISQTTPHLQKGIYKIKYYIDNNIANTTNNAHITVIANGGSLEYNYIISKYHSKTLTINTSGLECGSTHKISVKVDSQHNLICSPDDISDNYAERSFIVECGIEPYCGDGILDIGEECDDGNTENGDGCSANCDEEQEIPRCGDHVINQANETCDDGNLVNNDGCSKTCKLEYCGDGVKQTNEQCDDGNKINGDGCSKTCIFEFCGDGIVQPGEECDDGNTVNNDGCSANCDTEEEEPFCGDGLINQLLEQCDDGNWVNNDGCSSTCKLESCGDGIKQTNEQCDDGNKVNNDGCSSTCKNEVCGDGVKQTNEQCDDGNKINGDGCSANCNIETPYCGDSKINQANETCDDGNLVNNDGCSSTCKIERCGDGIKQALEQCDLGLSNGIACTPLYGSSCTYCSGICKNITLTGGVCGDGIKQTNEQCDDGNTNNLDSCRNNCKVPYCGDGIKDKNEYCDDGNNVNGDGCNRFCKKEATCIGESCGITPNITTEDFPPQVWQCDERIVRDDLVEPGTTSGSLLKEREQNYAFEGESIQWTVLVMDKNGINKVRDVYGSLDGNIEVNCVEDLDYSSIIESSCNARISEENLTGKKLNKNTQRYYTCTLTVETQDSMYGEYFLTVEAEDLDGLTGTMAEKEYWFLNPVVELGISGGMNFEGTRPGTSSYSEPIILSNEAEPNSGVKLNLFIAGTNFYDSSSSGALCPTTNQLSLKRFRYYATNGYYSTKNVGGVGPYSADSEGYMGIPNGERIDQAKEIIGTEMYSPSLVSNIGNVLTPGSEMSLILRLDLPELCNGDFNSGDIYFWGEAI